MPQETAFTVFHSLSGNVFKLLSDIYGLGLEKTAGDHSILRRKLDQMAKEMDSMVQEHITNTVSAMTKNAEAQCPHIFKNISDVIEENTKERSSLPDDFVKDHVIKQTGTEIINKVSELNLLVATLISDKVNDTLLAALSQCNTTLTEQLNKRKQERALTREEYKRPTSEVPEQNGVSHKVEVTPAKDDDVTADDDADSGKKLTGKKPTVADNILPEMRKERAASIAKRKQRPMSSAVPDLDYKSKTEPQPSPPRSVSPINEPSSDATPAVEPKNIETQEKHDEKADIEKKEDVEPVYAIVNKKRRQSEEDKEEKAEGESEEMVKEEESKEETKQDEQDAHKDDFDLTQLSPTTSKKLEHVTKGRARPTRRNHRKPVKTGTETDMGVDDFFTASVQSTDFQKVPTLAEEKEQAEKEETKKTPKRLPGMPGIGMSITPDMLKRKKKVAEPEETETKEEKEPSSPKEEEKTETEEMKNGEEDEEPKPKPRETSIRKKPPGAMGLPGMGFGGNMLAEMKLKKLNKSKGSDQPHTEKNGDTKHEPGMSPFGPSMLKKKAQTPSPAQDKKEVTVNSNNNNNKEWTQLKATPNRWKSRSFEKQEKPEIHLKPEFIDPKKVPSSVRLRATSWGKKDGKEEKK